MISAHNASPISLLCQKTYDVLTTLYLPLPIHSSNSQEVIKPGAVQCLPIRESSVAHKDHMPVGTGNKSLSEELFHVEGLN